MSSGVPEWFFTLMSLDPYLSGSTVIINLIHLFVLTRKEMRNSSTNVVMMGIAVMDLYTMSVPVGELISSEIRNRQTCRSPDSYLRWYLYFTALSLFDDTMRCTVFLGLSMAIIRVVVLKSATENNTWKIFENASGAVFGLKTTLGAFCLSSIISVAHNMRVTIQLSNTWKPTGKGCNSSDWPANYTQPIYSGSTSDLFAWKNGLLSRIYLIVDGIISKMIPSILFPILTFILIRQLRRVTQNRERLFSNDKKDKNTLTTKLVTYTTIAFTVTILPIGCLYVAQSFCGDSMCEIKAQTYTFVYQLLNPINSITHFFFCIFISSQYKSTVKSILGIDRPTVDEKAGCLKDGTVPDVCKEHNHKQRKGQHVNHFRVPL